MLRILVFILCLRKFSSREIFPVQMCGKNVVSFLASVLEMRIEPSIMSLQYHSSKN